MTGIDRTDYALLKCLTDADQALWKKKLHQCINTRDEELPGKNSVSLQTVGRRIDALHDADLISSCITTPNEVNRDLIIGYELTERGETVLAEKREEMLLSADHLVPRSDDDITERKATIITLLDDEFDLSKDAIELLEEKFDKADLVTLYAFYIVRQNLERLTGEDEEKFQELFELEDDLGKEIAIGITSR